MATWVTHLIVADKVMERLPSLCRREFCAGNIAPDCNVENEDWTSFTPSREITHWMTGNRKSSADCDRFLHEYMERKVTLPGKEESFLLGYYSHLITDAEFQRFIRDENRVKAAWSRIKSHSELRKKLSGMAETWDAIKKLIPGKERMKDIYAIEKEYLDEHPGSGYLTEIIKLESFPDYLDYLPAGAISRKVKVMGYMPTKTESIYPYVAISREEYDLFLRSAADLVTDAIQMWKTSRCI